MLMLKYLKCTLTGFKSCHDTISICRTGNIKVSDKKRNLMDNQARQDYPRIQNKIKEMPVGCLRENSARRDRPKIQATPREVLKRNAKRVSTRAGEIIPPENSRDAS
jgi:hypothetical protein